MRCCTQMGLDDGRSIAVKSFSVSDAKSDLVDIATPHTVQVDDETPL